MVSACDGVWRRTRRRRRLVGGAALVVCVLTTLAGCSSSSDGATAAGAGSNRSTVVHVVAAENFWGSIASQIGGSHVRVTSIITNPDTDPHDYEPTPADARTLAAAQLVIENGIGYDPWVAHLLAADGGSATVLDVGTVLGLRDGDNPHRWYNPGDVQHVISVLVRDLQRLDPADRADFPRLRAHFDTVSLAPYHAAIAAIRARYAGTPVGASESIFAMLAPALGLDLVTPPTFLRAISEGTDVSAADKQTIDEQITRHLIKIYVYNSQNVTPDVQTQLDEVRSEHIPVATITETLAPANVSYQAWQTGQLLGIERALAAARAR